MATQSIRVSVGDHVYVGDDLEEVGAVRKVANDHLVVYIENSGDFEIRGEQVLSAHDSKLILRPDALAPELQQAIAHAHEREVV